MININEYKVYRICKISTEEEYKYSKMDIKRSFVDQMTKLLMDNIEITKDFDTGLYYLDF